MLAVGENNSRNVQREINMDGYCYICGDPLVTGDNTSGMCSRCEQASKNGVGNAVPEGWECPRCGRISAPWMPYCDCSKTVEAEYSNKTGE